MITLTIDSLKEYLSKAKFPVEIQNETQQVYMLYKINDREFPLFMRIFGEGELLQLIAFVPCEMKPNARGDLARLLHRINKELDIPGFGMDEQASLIYYRLMIPSFEKKIYGTHLQRFITSIEEILKNFSPLIAYVSTGNSTFDEVQKKMQSIKGVQ